MIEIGVTTTGELREQLTGLRRNSSSSSCGSTFTADDQSTKSSGRRSVAFDCIEIIEFPIELGDNPSVHDGPPIQIGWKHHTRDVMELDVYEVFRLRRRGRKELPISMDVRMATLLSQGYTQAEIDAAAMECERVKQERILSRDSSE